MKSYQDHLKSLLNKSPTNVCQRASAIFPIFYHPQVSMKIIFLNYWRLKRGIDHLLCRLYLRDIQGNIVHKKCFFLDDIKCYEIDLFKFLGVPYPMAGSFEIQFSSPENLVFPYPAAAVVYQGKNFFTFVHSAQRLFNDNEGQKNTSSTKIIESGFNIYASENESPFITFINGGKAIENKTIKLIAYNQALKTLEKKVQVNCNPFETYYLLLNDWKELAAHLKGAPGCLKVKLFQTNTFPRLIVGNYNQSDASMSVTHTYYDLSHSQKESDYWSISGKKWYPLTLMLPLRGEKEMFTKVYFYPIYSPADFWVDVEIYNSDGTCLKKAEKFLKIASGSSFQCLDPSSLLKDLKQEDALSLRLIARPLKGHLVPARIKVGLDIGFRNKGFPCNICTNFCPANPALEKKSSAFRWVPMMPEKYKGSIWCLNDAPQKNYNRKAKLQCTFYRSMDEKTLSMEKEIKPHGAFQIKHNDETKAFFQGQIGWCVIESDNPYITTYYFTEYKNKMVGGDHGF